MTTGMRPGQVETVLGPVDSTALGARVGIGTVVDSRRSASPAPR